jgi:hypothetical protein
VEKNQATVPVENRPVLPTGRVERFFSVFNRFAVYPQKICLLLRLLNKDMFMMVSGEIFLFFSRKRKEG